MARKNVKSERLALRLTPDTKALILQAMQLTGLSAGDLAYEGARRVLDDHQRLAVSGPPPGSPGAPAGASARRSARPPREPGPNGPR